MLKHNDQESESLGKKRVKVLDDDDKDEEEAWMEVDFFSLKSNCKVNHVNPIQGHFCDKM